MRKARARWEIGGPSAETLAGPCFFEGRYADRGGLTKWRGRTEVGEHPERLRPRVNGSLPLTRQEDCASQIDVKYGYWTSVLGAIATWGVIAGRRRPASRLVNA